MKALFLSISMLIMMAMSISLGYATNYYVSNEAGNDNRSLQEAQHPATPWKSIDKVNTMANYLEPGDAILFRRGETFFGTLHIKSSGTATSPIVIGAYDSGSKPVITSFQAIQGWKSLGNGIYESIEPVNTDAVQILLINGMIHEMGRFPNSDVENEGYLTISDVSSNHAIYGDQLNSFPNWNGGEVVIKKNQWIINTHQIESHSGNQIQYNGDISGYAAQVDYGFFIQNHISTLDAYGEWYFNPSTRKMNVYFGNVDPAAMIVEVSTLDNLFTKDYRDGNITIESLEFRGANQNAIHLEGGNDIKIIDTEIEFSGEDGILALSVLDLVIERNTINHTYNNAMYLRYGNDGAIIRDNEVINTALIPGRTRNNDAAGIGIFVSGENVLVQNNSVINSGFNGIQFNGNHVYVKNNYVDTFCQIKGDGGGIYTYGGVPYQGYVNRKIEGNIVVNSIGSKGGIPKDGVNYKPLAEGIFLDDNANNVEIIGNTVGNTENNGLKMSNVNNIKVLNNTFFNSHSSITLGNSTIGEDTRAVTIEGNQFFSKTSSQNSYSIKTYKDDLSLMADFDKNYFFRPLGDEFSIFSEYANNGTKEEARDNLDQWREKFSKDQNSVSNTVDLSTYTIDKKIGSSLFANTSFDENVSGIYCNNCEQSWEANSKTSGAALKITNSGYSSIKINLGQLNQDKTYLLRFNAYAIREGNIQAYLRYTGSPWAKLSELTTFEVNTDVNTFEILVSPYTDASEVSLIIATAESNFGYWMDDLEFVEVEASFINTEEEILFAYNPDQSSKTIALDGTYVNAKLETFSGSVTIPSFGSIALIRVFKEAEEVPEIVKTPGIQLVVDQDLSQMTEGDELILNSEITNLEGNIEKVDFYCGLDLVGSCVVAPYQAVIEQIPSGENYIWATVTDKEGNISTSSEIEFVAASKVVAEVDSLPVADLTGLYYHLNTQDIVNYQGQDFEELNAEFLLTSGSNLSVNENGSDEVLFQTARFSEELSFKVPVENGLYTVQTYHNELYFGENGRSERAGQRVFDILIEGEIVKKDLDLFVENNNDETILAFDNIEVTDGFLDLNLIASVNNSLISGMAIIPVVPEEVPVEDQTAENSGSFYYNLGISGSVAFDNQNFEQLNAEFLLTSGSNLSINENGSDEVLFQTARFSEELSFKVPVENGLYTVQTYHNELYFGENGRSERAGQRVFDILIEGEIVKKDLDLFVENNNDETILAFDHIEVTDGFLDLDLIASANNSLISGIAIIPVMPEAPPVEASPAETLACMYYNLGINGAVVFDNQNFEQLNSEFLVSTGSNLSVNENGSDEVLFQTARFSSALNFSIPVENGLYTVQTYHNELYFGENGRSEKAGQRVFDILIEGEIVKKDLDLFVENNNDETILAFDNIEVTDGFLNLDLIASANNSLISGIAIISADQSSQDIDKMVMYLNTGYQDTVTFQDNVYVSGSEYISSPNFKTYINTEACINKIFQAESYSSLLNFMIPVENGTYTVKTYHNELYFGKGGPSAKAGNRVFDILLEDKVVKDDFDIFVHSNDESTILTFEEIQVSDGVLNLQLIAGVNNATISGISIIQESKDVVQDPGSDHLYFLNTGGMTDETLYGVTYLAEATSESYYNDGSGRFENKSIDVEALFQTERNGKVLKYTIPVPNGTYTVFTMHNELWFGYGGGTARVGQRVYDIALQGETLKSNFDLFVENNNNPTLLSFENIEVSDGLLTLEMNASANNVSISGIAIIGSAAKDVNIAANLRSYQDAYYRGYKEMAASTEVTAAADKDQVRIFPNPAKERATLEINAEIGTGSVLIHNMSGQLVSHFNLNWIQTSGNSYNIPLDNLAQGIYLVSISNEQKIINQQRLIVNP